MDEIALTLRQAAERLQLSYGTVYEMRHALGFRLPGSRVWRIWPSRLAELTQNRNNGPRLSLRVDGDSECQSAKIKNPVSTSLTSARRAAKELEGLLARPTAKKPRSTTTG
ncbi:phage integrase family protein [Burkholderia pseudomallei]|nr:phage integrase family protein [Burkholderia pseudomallei]CAJ4837721.1 phage integrase family protein [Burkholderia pseudomallei]